VSSKWVHPRITQHLGVSDERRLISSAAKTELQSVGLNGKRTIDKDSVIEEPCAGKLASTVLKQR